MYTEIARDPEGYLLNPEDWDENIATELAGEEGIELGDGYWPLFRFIRSFYDERGIAPDVRHVLKQLVVEHGYDKKQAKKYLYELFSYGYVQQACKISGMRRPRAWSTG